MFTTKIWSINIDNSAKAVMKYLRSGFTESYYQQKLELSFSDIWKDDYLNSVHGHREYIGSMFQSKHAGCSTEQIQH